MKTSMQANQLISQLEKLSKAAKSGATTGVDASQTSGAEFSNLFSKAINSVNQTQMESGRLANQVETGDGGVSLVKAMIASQKATVAFQATVQVRNRVVSAYQDIMNMPI